MKKIDRILDILERELVTCKLQNKALSDMIMELQSSNEKLESENEEYKRVLDKESDTEFIKYRGKTYAIKKRTLTSSPDEYEQLILYCDEKWRSTYE